MQKWEYWTVQQARAFGASINGGGPTPWVPEIDLDEAGINGWELVSAFPVSSIQGENWSGTTSEVVFIFKRPIEE